MRITGQSADCRDERSLACQTCGGAGIGIGDEGTYACTVYGGSGHVRCLSCDGGSRDEPSFWRSWEPGEAQSAT